MEKTITGPTTATTGPARGPGLARVLLAASIVALILRPLIAALLFQTTGGEFDRITRGDYASLFALINVINAALTVVSLAAAVMVLVLTLQTVRRRADSSVRWHESAGMACIAVAVVILCLPVEFLLNNADAVLILYAVRSVIAALAAVAGLVFIGRELRDLRAMDGQRADVRGLLATVLAAGAVVVLSVGSAGAFNSVSASNGNWMQPLVQIVVAILAVVSLVLAVVSRRSSVLPDVSEPAAAGPESVGTFVETPTQDGSASDQVRPARVETETDRGLLALQLIAPPAALALMGLTLVFGEFLWGLLLIAGLLALAAVVGAVVRARRRTGGDRWLDALGEVLVPGALIIMPLAVVIFSVADSSGWGALAGLMWSGMLAILVGLIGLVFTVVSVIGRRNRHPLRSVSALATALAFIPIALFSALLPVSGGLMAALAAGLCILVGLVAGGIAVAQRPAPSA